ncbi:hypothetical protein MBANPS3_007157 [Mucor bainieri]
MFALQPWLASQLDPDYYSNADDYHDMFFGHLFLPQDDAKEFLVSQTLAVCGSTCSFLKFAEQVYKTLYR